MVKDNIYITYYTILIKLRTIYNTYIYTYLKIIKLNL